MSRSLRLPIGRPRPRLTYPSQCSDCFSRLEREKGRIELNTATWRRVLDERPTSACSRCHAPTGEPTLRRDPRSRLRSRRYARPRITD
jgi:hypothetical protein